MKEEAIKFVLVVVLGAVVVWLYTRPSPEVIPYKEPPRLRPADCLIMSGVSGSNTSLTFEVSGLLENTCGRPFSFVSLSYTVLDASGAIVGTALANQTNIGTGQKWRFRAVAFANGTHYRLDSLTAH